MTQRHFAGGSAVSARYAGAQLVRRRYRGATLVWEHPDFPTLDFTSGSLPDTTRVPSAGLSEVTYSRDGSAYYWELGVSGRPQLTVASVDTPRFAVCPEGVEHSIVGQPMGLLFEPAGQNLLPYARADATGWTSDGITVGTTTGIDGVPNSARTLTVAGGPSNATNFDGSNAIWFDGSNAVNFS